jgi:hypothetical protein
MMNYFIMLGVGMFPQEGRRSQENLLDNNLLYYVLVHREFLSSSLLAAVF